MSGYVRIHRDLIGHPSFRNDAEAMAFAWLIVRAQWKHTRVRYKGRSFDLKRGQLAISQRDMADALDRDKAWIERLWKRCKDEAMISVSFEAGAAVLTICNYEEYQSELQTREAANEAKREAVDEADARQTQGTEQEDNNTSEAKASSVVNITARKPFACPVGVEPQHWRDFLANRKRRRLTNSETAYEGQLRALSQLADDEWPPGRLVQHAAEKGWGSINDPRSSGNFHGTRQSNSERGLRGSRPDPALDMYRDAIRREAEEGADGNPEADFGTWAALPACLTS